MDRAAASPHLRGAALALGLCLMATAAQATPASEPGVSRELARWRAAHYRDVRYALALRITERAEALEGTAQIQVTLPRDAPDLVLDWRPSAGARAWDIRVNGAPAMAKFEREHLIVPARQLRAGRNRVTLRFTSPIALSGSAVTRYLDREDGAEYVYTLFVPADASSAFPCFDQPDLKARFALELSVPHAWTAVGNAKLTSAEDAHGSMRRLRFAPTPPISTYLFAFAAGPFAEIEATSPGPTARLLVRKSRLARAAEEAPEVLRLNREALRWFEVYFDVRFPFPKYDLVLIPELAYGGMEHAGATFLREEAVLFPSAPNETDVLARAQLVFHETAHQWFGDLVTMRWFDDLWLKEGFANFMAAKAAEALLPGMPVWNAFHALKTGAYRTDVTQGTTPVYRPLANLAQAKSAYGSIVYAKAPAILRQTEFTIGEAVFRRAIRAFLKRHAFGSADWSELVAALGQASKRDLRGWAEAWVMRRGMPELRLAWAADTRGGDAFLEQRDSLGEGRTWPMKLRVLTVYGDGSLRQRDTTLRGVRTRLPALGAAPSVAPVKFAFANAGDYGYGRFLLDERSRAAVLERPQIVEDPLLRALVFDALWESVRDAELAPLAYLDFAVSVAPVERDPVTLATLLARAQVAVSSYASEAQRDAASPALEQVLAEGMLHGGTTGRRIAFFRSFVAAAWSPPARARLKALLSGTLQIPEVALSSRDRFRIAARLLALDDPEAPALLATQSAADSGGDGRRYAFAAGAAEGSAAAKRAYFKRFLDDPGLAEDWVDAALFPFNAVEHAALTAPLLEPALAALPALARTRKIFFANAWLAAFVGGQLDAQALSRVERAAQNPGLDPELRLKLLEAIDGLARTVKIRARYAF
jgi:aminopeptidase N